MKNGFLSLQITRVGIDSLLNGDFNNRVEKFPFVGWSLDGVCGEEFKNLESKFRVTHLV